MNKVLDALPNDLKAKLRKEPIFQKVSPMLATLTNTYFSHPGWIYEIKLDGQRCLFFKEEGKARLISRNKKEQNTVFPDIVQAIEALEGSFILDGELVTFDSHHISRFSILQNRMHVRHPSKQLMKQYPVYAYIFDILYLDGYDLTGLPLKERKKILKNSFVFKDPLKYLEHKNQKGEAYLKQACEEGLEGIIAKEAESLYVFKRSTNWLKFKCNKGQEFVVGGYTQPQGKRIGFGALLIGYYKKEKLIYAGRVGTGYNTKFLKDFSQRMQPYVQTICPFEGEGIDTKGVTWIKPHFVCEIGFTEWTRDGKLRHPRFLGLRTDKKARDVVREDENALT